MNAFRKNCPDHKKYLPSRFVPQPLVDESIFFSAEMEVLCILCLCEDLPMVLRWCNFEIKSEVKNRKKSNKPSFHLYHPGSLLVLRAWTSQIWKTRFNQHQSNQESKASEKNPISYFLIEKWDAVRRRPLTVFSVACHVLLFHIFVWLCLWDKLIECRSQNIEKF